MPINIINQNQDDEEELQQDSAGSVYTTPGTAAGAPTASAPKSTSGFTNIQRIAAVNRPQVLGQTIGQGIRDIAQQTQAGLQQRQREFQERARAGALGTEQDIQRREQVLSNIAQNQLPTQEDIATFERYRRGAYEGPQGIEFQQELLRRAQQAQSLAQATRDAAGRQALLQRFVGKPQYTQGQQRLDAALLGLAGQEPLQQARRGTIGLQKQIEEKAQAAEQQARALAQQAQAFGKETEQQIAQRQQEIDQALQERLAQQQQAIERKRQAVKDIQDLMQGKGLQEILGVGGQVIRQRTEPSKDIYDDINRALDIAREQGFLAEEDIDQIEELQRVLATPVQKFYRQNIVYDPGRLLRRYTTPSPGTQITPGEYVYSDLKLGDLLALALQPREASGLTKEALSTPEERNRLIALSQLAGTPLDLSNVPEFQDYRAAFNLAKAFDAAEKDIARLRGEAIEDLPTEIIDIPFEEKLRRTFMPTPSETVRDIKTELNKLTGENSSLLRRIGAIARLGTIIPLRTIPTTLSTGLSAVAKLVKKITCHATGTLVKMKNGTYKKIEDIKVGDELYLGGKVLMIGSSEIDKKDIYEYNGDIVSGSHIVFEDGQFIRVRDSLYSKRIKSPNPKLKLHPIVTERHLVVTKNAISTDYFGIDNGDEKTEEEVLNNLNSNKEKLNKLAILNSYLFNKENK